MRCIELVLAGSRVVSTSHKLTHGCTCIPPNDAMIKSIDYMHIA
jgi:hypothetical protein